MGPEIAAGAVAAASIGGLALDAGSSAIKGYGEKQGQDFMADQADRAAQLGRIKADQTDVSLREELHTTLSNIDVIRAAGGTDPLSPTGLAIKENETRISDRTRRTAVGNIQAQADERVKEASYRRRSGEMALIGGIVGGAAKVGKGFGSYGTRGRE